MVIKCNATQLATGVTVQVHLSRVWWTGISIKSSLLFKLVKVLSNRGLYVFPALVVIQVGNYKLLSAFDPLCDRFTSACIYVLYYYALQS